MPDTSRTRSNGDQVPAGDGFAVVELFTSQGCNSCPPAEDLLSEIDRDAWDWGQPVYAPGFHVDYWDYLGWIDPFGSEAHALRQEAYARVRLRRVVHAADDRQRRRRVRRLRPAAGAIGDHVRSDGGSSDAAHAVGRGRARRAPRGGGLSGRGRVELQVPQDLDPRHASVVGYVQNDDDRSIVGAAAVDVPAGRGR